VSGLGTGTGLVGGWVGEAVGRLVLGGSVGVAVDGAMGFFVVGGSVGCAAGGIVGFVVGSVGAPVGFAVVPA